MPVNGTVLKLITSFCATGRRRMPALFFGPLLLCAQAATAQTVVRADATIDTAKIKPGGQLHLKLEAEASNDIRIFFPQLPDSMDRLEVVERTKVDTVKSEDGNVLTYSQTLTLTSFDPGTYYLSALKFYYATAQRIDSIETDPITFMVDTITVDTAQAIRDIKPPLEVPYTWQEMVPYIIGGLLLAALVIGAIWLRKRLRRGKEPVKPKEPPRPAHEIAFKALKKLQDLKLWQQGFYKQYQSEVSDIIRTYIENRFGVPAMEMTTDETLHFFEGKKLINDEAAMKLRHLLQLADTVKFAKAVPIATENELAWQYAHDFVVLTKAVTPGDFNAAEKEVKT